MRIKHWFVAGVLGYAMQQPTFFNCNIGARLYAIANHIRDNIYLLVCGHKAMVCASNSAT